MAYTLNLNHVGFRLCIITSDFDYLGKYLPDTVGKLGPNILTYLLRSKNGRDDATQTRFISRDNFMVQKMHEERVTFQNQKHILAF